MSKIKLMAFLRLQNSEPTLVTYFMVVSTTPSLRQYTYHKQYIQSKQYIRKIITHFILYEVGFAGCK